MKLPLHDILNANRMGRDPREQCEKFMPPESLVGRGGFPGRDPRGFRGETFEGRRPGRFEGRMPEDFVRRAPSGFEGEGFNPKDKNLDKTMMLRDRKGGKKCPRCGTITDRPQRGFLKVWYVCLPWC